MLNRIVLMGRLTRDPELRRTQNGTAVTSFTLAVDRDFKSQSGERKRISSTALPGATRRSLSANTSRKAAWPLRKAVCSSATGRTGTATNAAARKLWLTTCILENPSARAAAANTAALRLMAHQPGPPARRRPAAARRMEILSSRRSARRTASCRSDFPCVPMTTLPGSFGQIFGI